MTTVLFIYFGFFLTPVVVVLILALLDDLIPGLNRFRWWRLLLGLVNVDTFLIILLAGCCLTIAALIAQTLLFVFF